MKPNDALPPNGNPEANNAAGAGCMARLVIPNSDTMKHSEKLKRIETLMASPDVIELDALTAEVAEYERKMFPMEMPSVAEAMKFRREQMGETQKEISVRANMTLAGWRRLEAGEVQPSITEAKRLYAIGIPAKVLLQDNAKHIHPEPNTNDDTNQ
jgi:antitoxin component HigA of HigAB toxin-antitoxin module